MDRDVAAVKRVAVTPAALVMCFGISLGPGLLEPACAQARFEAVGAFSDGTYVTDAKAVSADGSTVVGSGPSGYGWMAFRWTRTGGLIPIAEMTEARGVSRDGSIVVGIYPYGTTAVWSQGGGVQSLAQFRGNHGPTDSTATASADDGNGVAGLHPAYASVKRGFLEVGINWYWLDPLSDPNRVHGLLRVLGPEAVSADGRVIVGAATRRSSWSWSTLYGEAFRWELVANAAGGARVEIVFPDDAAAIHPTITSDSEFQYGNVLYKSQATDVTPDGAFVVGTRYSTTPFPEYAPIAVAFRWSRSLGVQLLGTLPGALSDSRAYGVNGTGAIVVGASQGRAFRWTPNSMRDLRSVLIDDYGLGDELRDWTLSVATDISDDGRTIVGNGSHAGVRKAWIATLADRRPRFPDLVFQWFMRFWQ